VNVAGSHAVVTGATGGLGHAIARRLHRDGARLTLTARRTAILEPLAAELDAHVIAADLADPDSLSRLVEAITEIDILVANAGLEAADDLADLSPGSIARIVSVNLQAPAVLAAGIAPHLAARRRGHVVFISSMAGKVATLGNGPLYTATKWGLRGLGLALREELRTRNVGVSTIFPGPIRDAGMFADTGATLPHSIKSNTAEEVAAAVASAIALNRAEVDVAAPLVRFGGLIGGVAPSFVAATARRQGADGVRRQMIAARTKGSDQRSLG
jgi:short-subunit dehydrogenase